MKTPDSLLISGEISGIKWESARKKMGGPPACFCQMKHPPRCTSSLCCLWRSSFIDNKWRVTSFNMDSEISHAGCQEVLCRSSPEEEEAPGGTQHLRINLNAFASSSVFMSWVGCPWCGRKQVEKLLRRDWNVVSVWESQEPHLSSPQHLCLIVTFSEFDYLTTLGWTLPFLLVTGFACDDLHN